MSKCKVCGREKASTTLRFIGNKNIIEQKYAQKFLAAQMCMICDDCYPNSQEES